MLLISAQLFAQDAEMKVIGKLYDKEEAEELFGPVLEKAEINSAELKSLAEPAEYVMFNIMDGNLYILDGKRALLSEVNEEKGITAEAYNKETVFSMYSKSMVDALMEKGGEEKTYVQKRKDGLITVGNGAVVLELTKECPPNCP